MDTKHGHPARQLGRTWFRSLALVALSGLSQEALGAESNEARIASPSFRGGFERGFGVAGYVQQTKVESEFGAFSTNNHGFKLQGAAGLGSRGDGVGGVDPSSLPRIFFDFRFASRWSVGMGFGISVATGQRTIESEDTKQDPYVYPTTTLLIIQPRVSFLLWSKSWFSQDLRLGPQFFLVSRVGDGERGSIYGLQATLSAPLFYHPFSSVFLGLEPLVDIPLVGRTRQSLQVDGVPDTTIKGSARYLGVGISLLLGFQF